MSESLTAVKVILIFLKGIFWGTLLGLVLGKIITVSIGTIVLLVGAYVFGRFVQAICEEYNKRLGYR